MDGHWKWLNTDKSGHNSVPVMRVLYDEYMKVMSVWTRNYSVK